MIFDIHVHIAGTSRAHAGNYLCARPPLPFLIRRQLRQSLRLARTAMRAENLDAAIERGLLPWVSESRVDRFVLLALDGAYQNDGTPDWPRTRIIVSNDYVADFAARHTKLLFGASIHPYRRDALEELERAVARGACLVKWIPSAQNIAPDDPRCHAFYEQLAARRMPLLVHTGIEHTLPTFPQRLNDPCRLKPALERGVTVIGAHCGTRVFLHERTYFARWKTMAMAYPSFYGDLSAFGSPLHLGPLREIIRQPLLASKVIYGSDFPVPVMPLWLAAQLGVVTALKLRRVSNPLDRAFQAMQALGVPQAVFTRAEHLLRLPATAETILAKRTTVEAP